MESDEFTPDASLNQVEAQIAASLSSDFIGRVDQELLSHAKQRNRKVAMIVGLAMGNPAVRVPGLPDLFYAQRIRALVARGALVAEGNLDFMRYSEVLRDLETVHVELPPIGKEAEVVSVIGSGIQNMNPTLIRVSVSEASRCSLLRVRAVAKEGAIQRSAELAVEKFMNELRARLPENALQSADEGESG